MLSYQHIYHAGNFADVIKHITLTLVCEYLIQKDKPIFYLETHSGRGLYDLTHEVSRKTGEFREGVGRLWPARNQLPVEFKGWISAIEALNNQTLRFYPGSPQIAIQILREIDRLYFCELHPKEFDVLKTIPVHPKKVHIHKCDGIERMNALLPPPEKRGLVFIDPSYEIKSEYQSIPAAIKKAYQKFATGIYCLWYPNVDEKLTKQLNRAMADIECSEKLHIEFKLRSNPSRGMTGCGLWVLNPPFVLKEQMEIVMTTLKHYLN